MILPHIPLAAILANHYVSYIDAFTILQSGQRIDPLRYDNEDVRNKNALFDKKEPRTDPPQVLLPNKQPSSPNNEMTINKNRKTGLLNLPAVEEWARNNSIKERHIKTLYRILLRPKQPSAEMPSPPSQERDRIEQFSSQLLQNDFPRTHLLSLLSTFDVGCTSRIVRVEPSHNNGGAKLVVELQNGSMVETVLIRHAQTAVSATPSTIANTDTSSSSANREPKQGKKKIWKTQKKKKHPGARYTVCVSSQIGCARACTFCATGTMGLLGNLNSCEILEQVWLAQLYLQQQSTTSTSGDGGEVRNVVFMGMGEPLDNYREVHEACRGFTHQCLFGFKSRHITLSTVGASPYRIRSLARDAPGISLALSLHGATDALREELIPSARRNNKNIKKNQKSSLEDLGEALDYHASCTQRGAMIEYLLIDGVNDSHDAADALGRFCVERQTHNDGGRGIGTYVNLIPYNPTLAGTNFGYGTPTNDRVESFCSRLRTNYGIRALVRWSSADGRDANGACGQLALTTTATTPSSSSSLDSVMVAG